MSAAREHDSALPRPTPPWLALGFRPFFLLAGSAAVVLMLSWLAVLAATIPPPGGPMAGVAWHGHEMIFGFALAIIAGFLLTAAPNWTGSKGLAGAPLALLAGLWLVGRVLAAFPGATPWWLGVAVDVAFPLSLALLVGVPIVRARSTRNLGIPVILMCFGALDGAFHLALAGHLGVDAFLPLRLAVHGIVLLMVVVGGRVTPAFTRNALRGTAEVRGLTALDSLSVASVVAVLLLVGMPGMPDVVVGGACALAAALNAARMKGWASRHTVRVPLLCILHLGYGWLVVGLGLEAVATLQPTLVPASAALHAFTTGAIGTYGLGMMSRVSLGHTGRPLVLHPLMTLAFVAVVLSGCVRVGAGLVGAGGSLAALGIAGTLWSAAFLAFLCIYTPILLRPRPDGRPG